MCSMRSELTIKILEVLLKRRYISCVNIVSFWNVLGTAVGI